jgi:hypothetical protein
MMDSERAQLSAVELVQASVRQSVVESARLSA